MTRLLVLVVVVIGTAGCGSLQATPIATESPESTPSATPTPSPTATATATPSPTASPSPTPFDVAAAADAYLALAQAFNAAACAQLAAMNSGDLATAQAGARALADAERVFADGLRQITLPPELEDDKEELLRLVAAAEVSERALAAALSVEEFNALIAASNTAAAAAASLSNYIRAELGLASTPESAC